MSLIFDSLAIGSVIGIWPRFVEPRCLSVSKVSWRLPAQFAHLRGKRFVQLSDLHLHPRLPQAFLDKIVRRTLRQKPDVIFFTGDFICHATLHDKKRLIQFLNRLQAPYGSYCVLGNHDYAAYVSSDAKGVFAIRPAPNPLTACFRGLRTLLSPSPRKLTIDPSVYGTPPHPELIDALRQTPFVLLENATVTLPIGINVTGLGECALGVSRPQTAFSGYRRDLPGIVLVHNPDAISLLKGFPGDCILAGHTHGEQIHLPFLRPLSRKLTRLVNPEYTRGKYDVGQQLIYVSRGLGSPKPFRFLSPPEIVVLEAV